LGVSTGRGRGLRLGWGGCGGTVLQTFNTIRVATADH
jgi:hypothetical protein